MAAFEVFTEAFEFMNAFFDAQPNHNHLNLAYLAAKGKLNDIVTLTFDFLIEDALETTCRPHDVFSSYENARRNSNRTKLRIHKPHGTLYRADYAACLEKKTRNIRYTISQIGTALDPRLIDWLQSVIGDKSVLVTGYSAQDLSVFPALQCAIGNGRIYWNDISPPPPLTQKWLTGLGEKSVPLPGDINDYLGVAARELADDAAEPQSQAEALPVSLTHLTKAECGVPGVLLAAALLCHGTEVRPNGEFRDAIIEELNSDRWKPQIEGHAVETWLEILKAGRDHETGDVTAALDRYRQTSTQFRQQEPDRKYEHVIVETEGNLAYNAAWPLKRPNLALIRSPRTLARAAIGLVTLAFRAWGPRTWRAQNRALASHFVGEFLLTWAMACDLAAPANPVARFLYRFALVHFRRATTPVHSFVPRDVFHYMRRTEAELHIVHTGCRPEQKDPLLDGIDRDLSHYRYLNGDPDKVCPPVDGGHCELCGAMNGDASRGVHLLLEAMRAAVKGNETTALATTSAAKEVFQRAGYASGLYRAQMYAWLIEERNEPWTTTIPLARERFRYAASLRDGFRRTRDS